MTDRLDVYFEGQLITEEQCKALENTGAAHVATGASGGDPNRLGDKGIVGHDPDRAWIVMMRGPGNCWIETVEGNCPSCGCAARLHEKKHRKPWPSSRSAEWSLPSSWDYGTLCPCGCTVDIPHGRPEAVLG